MLLFGLDIPLWVAFGITAVCLLYWYGTSTYGVLRHMGIPCLPPVPFLGNNLTQMSMPFHEYDLLLREKLPGKIYGSYQGRIPMLEIADVDFVKQVTIKDFSNFTNRRDILNERTVVTTNLAGIKDAHWKHVRATLTPTFTSGKLKQMYSQVNQCADKLVAHIMSVSSAPLAIKQFAEAYTMDVIATTAFGMDIDAQSCTDHPFIRHARPFFGLPNNRSTLKQNFVFVSIFMIPKLLQKFIGLFTDMSFVEVESLQYFGNIIDQIFSRSQSELAERKNFIAICAEKLIEDEKEMVKSIDGMPWSPKGLTKNDIIANSYVFFTAGYETTASSLQYFLYNMALNPDVQEKLYRVLCEVDTEGGEVSYERLKKIDYMDWCINESLRLFPPVSRVDRVANKDITINGIHIPSGMIVNILIYNIQRDPDYWPEPDKYDPERFSPENMTETQKNAFIPFGSGNRSCIASRLAMLELQVAIFKMLRRFRFEKTADTPEMKDLKFAARVVQITPQTPLKVAAIPRG